ncbi:hybrid sensor histidine kinase/response regulator [Sphingomonas jaspsi]|uniref:hybrid sensor histidine kinase/response regulator n=1 Tax=Sphingomonas jaspsi TaxID=392409 RepID=UPI0004AF740C|nr:PAS domain-containing sensor histidine kinase [Sphingomonas jaspsi]
MASGGQSESRSDTIRSSDDLTARKADETIAAGSVALIPGIFDFHGILAIADVLPVMIAYIDRDLVYRFVNKPIADWYERPRSAMLGQHLPDVMGTKTFESRRPRLEAALAGERQFFTAAFDHPTRGTLSTQSDYVPHVLEDGSVAGLILVIQDVTEQRAAEQALRESEQRFRRISDSAPVPMWVTRIDGSRDFVNQAYHDFFGFSDDERGQHDWQSAIHPDDRDDVIEGYLRQLERKESVELVGRFRRADGEWRWLRSVSMPRVDGDGNVVGFIGTASDVTEAKEAEFALQRLVDERTADLEQTQDQLRQAQKMEALGQLTGGIAHDFNNLLTVVVGGLDLIAKRVEDDRLKRYAESALSAAERGARLTAQLLAFSRVQRLEVQPTAIAPLIGEMAPLLRNVLGPGIDKMFDLDQSDLMVMADPTQLEVAVLNLAINARDAMPGGGTLSIATRPLTVEGDPELDDGDYVELSIQDTGLGMPDEVRARAFEPFFTTKDVGKGTGLGLSMVYGMARQSGGTARIESRDGKGTTVRLLFRRAGAGEAIAATINPERNDGTAVDDSLCVLVVDDDPDVRAFIDASLQEFGHRTRLCGDARQALAQYEAVRPDVVILDYIMPGLSGADVARQIRSLDPKQPILFVSGYSETDEIRAAAPDAQLLAKPFRPAALDEAIRALIATQAAN